MEGCGPSLSCRCGVMWPRARCWPGLWVVFRAWVVFCLGCLLLGSLWRLMLWFLRNVARNSPTCISNVEITPLEFCGFLDTYEKLGYPNYVRVLVDEAPKANSCVRSSSHDTAHDPRDASNTTPTPHNAKSPLSPTELSNGPGPGTQRFAFPGPAGACQRRQVT